MNFGGEDDDSAAFVQETREGEYILAGRTSSYGMVSDVWVIKVGSEKNTATELDNTTAKLEETV